MELKCDFAIESYADRIEFSSHALKLFHENCFPHMKNS